MLYHLKMLFRVWSWFSLNTPLCTTGYKFYTPLDPPKKNEMEKDFWLSFRRVKKKKIREQVNVCADCTQLDILIIITPHHMLHPQPTRQNSTVNSWAAATNMLTKNEPILDCKLSFIVNLGFPTHRHSIPLKNVPKILTIH